MAGVRSCGTENKQQQQHSKHNCKFQLNSIHAHTLIQNMCTIFQFTGEHVFFNYTLLLFIRNFHALRTHKHIRALMSIFVEWKFSYCSTFARFQSPPVHAMIVWKKRTAEGFVDFRASTHILNVISKAEARLIIVSGFR